MLTPQIHAIYIAQLAGKTMTEVAQANVVAGQGILGDRYAAGLGAFSSTKPKIRHISFIALTAMIEANARLALKACESYSNADTRRNIVLSQISVEALNALVGKVFYVGGLSFRGTELCEPCQRPAKLLGRPDFKAAFENSGGLRAEALDSGTLFKGALFTMHKMDVLHH